MHIENVVRGEVQLTMAKARDEIRSVAQAWMWRGVGAVLFVIGYVMLMMAAAGFLELHLARWQGLLILAVGNVALALGLLLVSARNRNSSP